jgi:hypothetical protein
MLVKNDSRIKDNNASRCFRAFVEEGSVEARMNDGKVLPVVISGEKNVVEGCGALDDLIMVGEVQSVSVAGAFEIQIDEFMRI